MKYKLLVDSREFMAALGDDLKSAKHKAYLQTLSFEGDSAGLKLSAMYQVSPAADRRIIADCYTKHMISDRFILSPKNLFDRSLRKEIAATKQMVSDLTSAGVEVKYVNPAGLFLHRFPARNHKKLIAIDDRIAYLGGINFSEHNFQWHDLMLRIEDEQVTVEGKSTEGAEGAEGVARFLADDFLATWEGKNLSPSKSFGSIDIHFLDGHNNQRLFQPIFDLIASANEHIWIESPYLTFPFYDSLRAARQRGVKVSIVTPEKNNRSVLNSYMRWESNRSDFALHLYPNRMTHLKAMLVDNTRLVIGSSNFDYLSYTLQQEVFAIITDHDLINDFRKRIVDADLSVSPKYTGKVNPLAASMVGFQMQLLGGLMKFLNGR